MGELLFITSLQKRIFVFTISDRIILTFKQKMSNNENNTVSKPSIFLKMESSKIFFGLLILLISGLITMSMLSYFFTGGADQSLVENLDLKVADEIKAQVQNWIGYRGAVLSEWFMAKTFGVPCFAVAYFIARCGLKMMGFLNGNVFRLFTGCLFFTIWTSFFLSFIGAENSFFNFGGQCGLSEVTMVEAQIGAPGAFVILLFTLVVFLYLFKGITLVDIRDYCLNLICKIKALRKPKENEQAAEAKPNEQDDEEEPVSANSNQHIDEQTEVAETSSITSGDEDAETVEGEDNAEVIEERPEADTDSYSEVVADSDTSDEGLEETQEVDFTINAPLASEVIQQDEEEISDSEPDPNDAVYKEIMDKYGPYDPTEELKDYEMPSLDLLADYPSIVSVDEEEQRRNKDGIVAVLKDFGIEIISISATVGPTITLYEIVPASGVRISKIQSLDKNIALSLAAKAIRIIAPIPGKGTVGIEVPNKKPQIVSMKSVLASAAFQESKAELPVAFGRTITNEVFMVDLAKTPHLLVAGATGMGKSVGLNVLLTSLLYKKHPATMKLVMVDPKQVEFSIYEKIEKHYLAKLPGDASAIITDTTKVVQTLTSLTTEMENRYSLLADVHLRNIKEYNAKFISRKINPAKELPNGLMHHYLPYIVVIIDEYGDLLMTAGKEIETPIARIAQKARAVGIHMVIATQRPSVKIVTGTIKANFPARLAFRVASRIDSQTILDAPGAQELVGKGDMLYSTGGAENTRVQCAFVDTPEVEDVNNFIGNQHGYPEAYRLPEFVDENGDIVGALEVDTKSLDPRLREAAELIVNCQNGSTSNIQRTLEVGFNRAGRIMDQLQAICVVGPVVGSKPREVLVHSLPELDVIFNNLKK